MIQEIIVIAIVLAAASWLGLQAYRFIKPRPGGKACGGNCCDNAAPPPPAQTAPSAPKERVMMIRSDDLVARLKARKS